MTQSSRQVQMLWRNLLSPPSGETCTLKMEAAGSSETSVHIYNTTKCHISADSNVHSNYCENTKSHIMIYNEHKYVNCLASKKNQNTVLQIRGTHSSTFTYMYILFLLHIFFIHLW